MKLSEEFYQWAQEEKAKTDAMDGGPERLYCIARATGILDAAIKLQEMGL